MSSDLERTLRDFARRAGAGGFTFDELCTAAMNGGVALSEVADWLARRRMDGELLDLGLDPSAHEAAPGPRRYCLAEHAAQSARIDLRLPAEPRTVRMLRWAAREFAKRNGVEDHHRVELAVSEAATNAVLHAYPPAEPGEVRLVGCAEPERIVVVVRDWGPGGLRPRAESPGLGVGLPTMAQLASSFSIETPDGGGTLIRMHFARG